MRRLLFLFSAFIGALISSPANSGQKDLGSGEFSTYVPIPTYTVVDGKWGKKSGKCYWEVDLKVKQLGGKEINFGSFEVESPYLCEWDSFSSGDIKPYLEKEAGYLNQVVEGVDEELKGKVGGSILLYSFNFNDKGQNWYYTGGMFSGFLASYGWQNAKSNKGEVFFYNSTGGQISLQAPKPTDRADALPVLDTSDSSYLGKKANELNHQVRGGYALGDPTKKVVPLGGRYDTIAENYSDTTCGNSININAYKEGKGIRAFEEKEVMPYLRENNIDQAVVYFFYSPVVIDLDDDVDRREVWAECPGGYQYDCSIDKCFKVITHFLGCECHEVCSSCPEDAEDCTPECETVCIPQCSHEVLYAQPIYWFGVNHKITLHLSREVRGEIVSADEKRTFLVDTELPLPDYTYNVYVKRKLPVKSISEALFYTKDKSIAVDDCHYGQLTSYNGKIPVNDVSSCSSPSFGCPFPCDSPSTPVMEVDPSKPEGPTDSTTNLGENNNGGGNDDFEEWLKTFYKHAFGRNEVDEEGLAYWTGEYDKLLDKYHGDKEKAIEELSVEIIYGARQGNGATAKDVLNVVKKIEEKMDEGEDLGEAVEEVANEVLEKVEEETGLSAPTLEEKKEGEELRETKFKNGYNPKGKALGEYLEETGGNIEMVEEMLSSEESYTEDEKSSGESYAEKREEKQEEYIEKREEKQQEYEKRKDEEYENEKENENDEESGLWTIF